jgi:hypothetical protein
MTTAKLDGVDLPGLIKDFSVMRAQDACRRFDIPCRVS